MRWTTTLMTALISLSLAGCDFHGDCEDPWWMGDDGTELDLDDDRDGDGLADDFEDECNTSPNNPDTDGDGVGDADEDPDGDGWTNGEEQDAGTDPGGHGGAAAKYASLAGVGVHYIRLNFAKQLRDRALMG